MISLGLLLAACTTTPTGHGDDPLSDCTSATHLVATTTDYAVGAIATLDLATLALADDRAPTSGDPNIAVEDCTVYQLNRGLGDSVRVYTPGQWSAPDVEFALPEANPHAIVPIGGSLWISAFDRAELMHVDATGAPLTAIDLSAWADADGLPEADALLRDGDRLALALQRLDRAAGWVSDGGVIVWVDPATGAIGDEVLTGPNPRVYRRGDGFLLLTGHLTELDGEIALLADSTAVPVPQWTEQDLGEIALDYAELGDVGLLLTASPGDYGTTARCVDWRTGELVGTWHTDAWIAAVALERPDRAWLALRPSWGAVPGPSGLLPFDPQACEPLQSEPIATHLPPYDLAVY